MTGQEMSNNEWEWFVNVLRNLERLMERIEAGQNTQQWFTVREVAEILGKSPYTIREYVKSGKLKATRVGGAGDKGELRISRDAIDDFRNPDSGVLAKLKPKKPSDNGHAVLGR